MRVKIAYHAPSDAGQREFMDEARECRFLERVGEVFEVVQFPRPLTLSLGSSGGQPNAWYDPVESSVTFCYEYLAEIRRKARPSGFEGATLRNATNGPAVFVLLHESGHGVIALAGSGAWARGGRRGRLREGDAPATGARRRPQRPPRAPPGAMRPTPWRAGPGCREEYQQALFATKKLIAPSVDAGAVERLRTKHGPAWDVRR